MQQSTSAAQLLSGAFMQRKRITEIPAAVRPATQDDAYACQRELVESLLKHRGGTTIGYKIACTNALAQELLSSPEPFYGRMFSSSSQTAPARFKADDFFMRVMEAEFAFQFAHELQPTAQPASREQIVDTLAGLLPGIEIVDSRYTSWTTVGAPSLIADNACHGAWVKGALLTDWKHHDLVAQPVELRANGKVVERGSGAAVLGHPLNALQWLVHRLHAKGVSLLAGEYVTTGVTTNIYLANAGDTVTADFGPIGSVEVSFE